jgi:hypothetical protein
VQTNVKSSRVKTDVSPLEFEFSLGIADQKIHIARKDPFQRMLESRRSGWTTKENAMMESVSNTRMSAGLCREG